MKKYAFNRMEIAGSLGDLGTLLPIAIGMIMINGLNPAGLFFSIGIFYIIAGHYYGVPVPVQPMKVIGAYAIATGLSASQITASGLWMGILLLIIGASGLISWIGKYIPKSVVRGVQLSTGILLLRQGVWFITGDSQFQKMKGLAEPFLNHQYIGPIPIGIIIGCVGAALTMFFLENRKFPAGLVVILAGLATGLALGTHEGLNSLALGISLPEILPFGLPSGSDFSFALFFLVLPQIPMTLGNAVIANADLSQDYFKENSSRVSYRALCISMGLANLGSMLVGGMPLCHGAGGLAAHYRFGARTAGSNLIIGMVFIILALFFGIHALALIYLIPMSILGVLLIFAGSQLAMTIIDLLNRIDLFIALGMLGLTLAVNLAVGFLVGIALAYALQSTKLSV